MYKVKISTFRRNQFTIFRMLSDRQKFTAQPAANNKAPAWVSGRELFASLGIKNLFEFLI